MARVTSDDTTPSSNVVRFPTAAAPDRFQNLPDVDLRTLAQSDTHVMFALSISREVLTANFALIARLMNAATGH